MQTTHKYNPLNPKQLRLLKLIYKFRFITVPLLLEYKGVSSLASLRSALQLLVDQKYLARRYSSRDKLLGKAARYYLAPAALTYLSDEHHMNKAVLHNMYSSKTAGESFISHNLDVM